MSPSVPTPPGAAPGRTPVQFDERTGDLRIGPYERHVDDPAEPEQVYDAYLSLLYAVRRAEPGERLPLRAADLEALLLLVGDDPQTIESRLVALMGCTPAEAGILGRLLLKQRRATATLGIAALSLAGAGLVTQLAGDEQVVAPVTAEQSSGTTTSAAELPAAPPQPVAPAAVDPAAVDPVAVGPVAVAPVAAPPPAPAPLRPVVVGPQASEVTAARPAVRPAPGPVVRPAAPAPAAPAVAPPVVEVAPEDRYVLPLVEAPVLDAPPPVVVPESGIGEPISLEPDLEPISGIGGSEDHVHEPISGETGSSHEVPTEPVVEESVPPAAVVPPVAEAAPVEPVQEQVVPDPLG